jgi:hypothetical protein
MADDETRISFPFCEWAEEDQKFWARAFPRTSIAAARAPNPKAALLSPKYIRNILQTMERFLFFQNCVNAAAGQLPLEKRLLRQDIEAFVPDLITGEIVRPKKELEATSIESYLDRLLAAARRLDPSGNYNWLRRLARKHRPVRRAPESPPLDLEALIDLGFDAMDEARAGLAEEKRRGKRGDHQSFYLTLYRDGLLLVFLALMGMRIGETMSLEHGLSFLVDVDSLAPFVVDLAAAATKMRRAKVRDVPTQLHDGVGYYLEHIRPGFRCAAETRKVWLGIAGPLTYQGAYAGMRRLVYRRSGELMNPTGVRHAIADEARLRGDSKESLAQLLGQVSIETAGRFYTSHKVLSDISTIATLFDV